MSLTAEVTGKTDIGCVRKNNEDNLGWDQRVSLYVVCDGMGGALAGVAEEELVDAHGEAPEVAGEGSPEHGVIHLVGHPPGIDGATPGSGLDGVGRTVGGPT